MSPSTKDGPEFKLKAASDLLNLDWMKDVKQCLNYRTILHLQRQFPKFIYYVGGKYMLNPLKPSYVFNVKS